MSDEELFYDAYESYPNQEQNPNCVLHNTPPSSCVGSEDESEANGSSIQYLASFFSGMANLSFDAATKYVVNEMSLEEKEANDLADFVRKYEGDDGTENALLSLIKEVAPVDFAGDFDQAVQIYRAVAALQTIHC